MQTAPLITRFDHGQEIWLTDGEIDASLSPAQASPLTMMPGTWLTAGPAPRLGHPMC